MTTKSRYIKNSFFNVAGWVWLVILNILTTPYIVHKLGYDAYGVYALVLLVLGYFAFLDFGLGDAVIRYFAFYHAKGDTRKLNAILNSILFLYLVIGLFGGVLIIIFTKCFAIQIFKIPESLKSSAVFCFYLGALGFILNLVFGVISKIPEALQRFDLSNRNNIIVGTFVTLANVVVLYLGYGLKEVVLVNLVGSLAGIIIFFNVSLKLVPAIRINLKFSPADFKEIFSFGTYTIFTKFSSLITSSINQLVVGLLAGPAGVTVFNVPFKVISRIQGLVYKIAFTVFPITSELHAKDDMVKLRRVYLKLSRYVFLLSSICFIPMLAYSREILLYWMGPEFAQRGWLVFALSSATFFLITLTMVPGLVALGLGKPKYNAIFSFITAIINLVFVYPLTKKWGVDGAAGALFLSSLQVPFAIAFITKKVVGIGLSEYFDFVFRRFLLLGSLMYLFFYFTLRGMIINGFMFLLIVSLSFGICLTICYLWGADQDDKTFFRNKLASLGLLARVPK